MDDWSFVEQPQRTLEALASAGAVQISTRTVLRFLRSNIRGMPISATTKAKQDLYLPNPAQNPSPNSRLGDIGYVDHTGTWRRVVNALDATSCDQLGIKPLRLQGLASEYITDRLVHQREPIVNLYGADAGVEMFTDGEELAKYTPVYDGI